MAASSLQSAPQPAPASESDPPAPAAGEGSRAALVVYKGEDMSDADDRRTLAYGHDAGSGPAPSSEQPEREGVRAVLDGDTRRIGDFLVRRLIGEGGMGKVYEAEERLSRRRVALKVLRSELSRSEAGRRAFVNEMGILASLDDPHVVRCLHCTEVEGELVMALEYLEGETLRERMHREGAMAWDEVVAIAWQICAALAAAHGGEHPIIHRDLKPENVMLVGGGRVKVMDFGIAKVVQAASGHTTHSVGTLQYMSPEQIDAQPLDPRSDLYALGLVMWELLAGRPPFEAESPRILLNKLCTEPAPELPEAARRGLPRGVEQLIHQLLEKAPDDRPASAAKVMETLEPFRPAELTTGTNVGSAAERSGSSEGNLPAAPASGSVPAAASAAASSNKRETTPRLDTVAVLESASTPRDIPMKLAISIIVSLSLTAGLITWLIRMLSN